MLILDLDLDIRKT